LLEAKDRTELFLMCGLAYGGGSNYCRKCRKAGERMSSPDIAEKAMRLHAVTRLGHTSFGELAEEVSRGGLGEFKGLEKEAVAMKLCEWSKRTTPCADCALANARNGKHEEKEDAKRPGERMHADVADMDVGVEGYSSALVVVDKHSGFVEAVALKRPLEVPEALKFILHQWKQHLKGAPITLYVC